MGLLIPNNRLKMLPPEVRMAHEYCFFLHDSFVRMLVEYEAAEAHLVNVPFSDAIERGRFSRLAREQDVIAALRTLGRHTEARRVILNTITMAMVSDCGHHVYEALRCFEKRKIVPGFNLLRKPLLDSLTYLCWIAADEDAFYAAFTSGDPAMYTQKVIGNKRREIFAKAIHATSLDSILSADDLVSSLFDAGNSDGLYKFFQHAVHLVTVERIELKTSPENFNFIFKHPFEDDVYFPLYAVLTRALLLLSQVVALLYERVKIMDSGARRALNFRSINFIRLLYIADGAKILGEVMNEVLGRHLECPGCNSSLKMTEHNVARLLISDSFRCVACRKVHPFPFSWSF